MLEVTTKKLLGLGFEGHLFNPNTDINHIKYAFIGLGQGGGKQAIEFASHEHYVSLFNTASQDLSEAKSRLINYPKECYKLTKFGGIDGAAKKRTAGEKAVIENIDMLERELVNDENLKKADFVWVTVALGGGTGSGSVTNIVRVISNFIRTGEKRIGYEEEVLEDGEIYITSEGKPTVGIIAAMPSELDGHHMQLNAAEALQELIELQEQNLLGNILLVDNDQFIASGKTDWKEKSNREVFKIIQEITLTSSLESSETLDKSEVLDIFSEPGFLNIHKVKTTDANFQNLTSNSLFGESFCPKNVKLAGVVLVSKEESKLNNTEVSVRRELNKTLENIKYMHFGRYYSEFVSCDFDKALNMLRTPNPHLNIKDKEIMLGYSLLVSKNPAEKVEHSTREALERRNKTNSSIDSEEISLKKINLKDEKNIRKKSETGSMSDMFKSKSSNKGTRSNIDSLKEMFKKA